MKPKILLVDDEETFRFGFVRYLSSIGYDVIEAWDLTSALRVFSTRKCNAVIVDINLPDGNGLSFIESVRQSSTETPIIVITGAGDIPLAVDAMRRGADNFLTKPVDMEGLELFLKKYLEIGGIRKLYSTRQRLIKKEEIWFGESPRMKDVVAMAAFAAENDSPVLITGETGTGKGVLARWIHQHSDRSAYALVEVNCSGLRGDLFAKELFGNVRGAFTSADRDREGLLDAADNGTLFLDEIGEMDMGSQAQFLKVLEEKTYRRLGDPKLQWSDFRLICATNKRIEEAVRKGDFRRDLYFRINLFTIHVPPLRERIDDLPNMARHLLNTGKQSALKITEEALRFLKTYSWPGNVRELKNVLERAVILARGQVLTPEHFSWLKETELNMSTGTARKLAELELNCIRSTLAQCHGDIVKAAKILGISRATLYRRLKVIKDAAS